MSLPDLSRLPGIDLREGEPVFSEPWEAQAFAMAVHLHATGAFTWVEWAEALSAEIQSGEDRPYYGHWLAALEGIVIRKALTDSAALAGRKTEWLRAAERTRHGQPITLEGG